jgi:hypothetical protein
MNLGYSIRPRKNRVPAHRQESIVMARFRGSEDSQVAPARVMLTLLALCAAVFAAAFAVQRIFFSDVVPIAWAEEPQALWAIEGAFLLRAIENIAAIVAAIVLIIAGLRWVRQRARLR